MVLGRQTGLFYQLPMGSNREQELFPFAIVLFHDQTNILHSWRTYKSSLLCIAIGLVLSSELFISVPDFFSQLFAVSLLEDTLRIGCFSAIL